MDRWIALIAHDTQKDEMLEVATTFRATLANERIVATGTTGSLIAKHTGLEVRCVMSGPQGGDLQIGAMVASGEVKLAIFLRDPLSAHPHEPDIQALLKVCDVHDVPLATNRATAMLCLAALERDRDNLAGLAGERSRIRPRTDVT